MFYIYILKSEKNGRYYIGSTSNVERRSSQHNSGNVKFTRNIRPLRLVLVQEVTSRIQARKVELRLKKLKRRDYIDKIVKDGRIRMDS